MSQFLGFTLSQDQQLRAVVPNELSKRIEMALRCAKLHAQRNPSDPFAYVRAYSYVMNGLLDEHDFNSGNVSV